MLIRYIQSVDGIEKGTIQNVSDDEAVKLFKQGLARPFVEDPQHIAPRNQYMNRMMKTRER